MMNIALTNLGKYNEGELVFTWLELPATDEELAAAFDKIGVSHDDVHYYGDFGQEYEEFFISDYECEFMRIGEYDNLENLNEIAETLDGLDEMQEIIVKALLNDTYDLERALEIMDDCIVYYDCDSMEDVAIRWAEETGLLDSIPENLQCFFDFEAYGREMELAGHFISFDNGYIEVLE
jgi:antirestriction protein